jgi:hypothetical protein
MVKKIRLHRVPAFALVTPMVFAYAAMTGLPVSAVRAANEMGRPKIRGAIKGDIRQGFEIPWDYRIDKDTLFRNRAVNVRALRGPFRFMKFVRFERFVDNLQAGRRDDLFAPTDTPYPSEHEGHHQQPACKTRLIPTGYTKGCHPVEPGR